MNELDILMVDIATSIYIEEQCLVIQKAGYPKDEIIKLVEKYGFRRVRKNVDYGFDVSVSDSPTIVIDFYPSLFLARLKEIYPEEQFPEYWI